MPISKTIIVSLLSKIKYLLSEKLSGELYSNKQRVKKLRLEINFQFMTRNKWYLSFYFLIYRVIFNYSLKALKKQRYTPSFQKFLPYFNQFSVKVLASTLFMLHY